MSPMSNEFTVSDTSDISHRTGRAGSSESTEECHPRSVGDRPAASSLCSHSDAVTDPGVVDVNSFKARMKSRPRNKSDQSRVMGASSGSSDIRRLSDSTKMNSSSDIRGLSDSSTKMNSSSSIKPLDFSRTSYSASLNRNVYGSLVESSSSNQTNHKQAPPIRLNKFELELAEPALDHMNCILCCPLAGPSKTLIVGYICQKLSERAVRERKQFKALFIVFNPSFLQETYDTLGNLIGEHSVHRLDDSSYFSSFFNPSGVLVVTANQIMLCLSDRTVSLDMFNTLIIDQCHLFCERGKSLTLDIMKYYWEELNSSEPMYRRGPKIVGLTDCLHSIPLDQYRRLCAYWNCQSITFGLKTLKEETRHLEDLVEHVQSHFKVNTHVKGLIVTHTSETSVSLMQYISTQSHLIHVVHTARLPLSYFTHAGSHQNLFFTSMDMFNEHHMVPDCSFLICYKCLTNEQQTNQLLEWSRATRSHEIANIGSVDVERGLNILGKGSEMLRTLKTIATINLSTLVKEIEQERRKIEKDRQKREENMHP